MDILRSSIVSVGHFLFRFRNYLFPLVLVLLVATAQPAFLFGNERIDEWIDVVAVGLALVGQACRVVTVGCVENIRRGGRQQQIAAETLIRHGPFAYSRNPLYCGNVLILSGLIVIANNRWGYLLALPGFISVYWAIVWAEEEFLTRRFGRAYADYCRTVNRFVPSLTDLRHVVACGTFDWRRAVRKEYRVVCAWVSVALFLLIWERWEQGGYTQHPEIGGLLLLLHVVALTSGATWWVKKNGKLRSR